MDAVGIAGFHQFDAGGVNMPKAAPFKRPYLSDSWKEAYRYAVRLADSLGMEMTVASAPGWSCTGGPWVAPEDAMKKLEWKIVDVKGGKLHLKLPELGFITGPYLDIPLRHESKPAPSFGYDVALVAVKLTDAEKSMEELGAKLSRDGELDLQEMKKILGEVKKGEINRVTFKNEQLHRFFPKEYSAERMKERILDILKLWQAQQLGNTQSEN